MRFPSSAEAGCTPLRCCTASFVVIQKIHITLASKTLLSIVTGYNCWFPSYEWLQTLILGFNSLSDLSNLPWAALASLESLDLSSNRLRNLGDVVLMTWLRRLNLENNEISPVPLELGLCTGEHTSSLHCS